MDGPLLLRAYRAMREIREFEEHASRLYRDSMIPGFVHLSTGQEAVAVGACLALDRDDIITSTHRGHGHCLAKGLEPREMFAELMGRETGVCRGRGGSMHMADPRRGIFGANGIVGAGLPIAAGAATALQLENRPAIALCFFGDGAIAQGMFHEALIMASSADLPVLFLCENNQYAEFSSAESLSRTTIEKRVSGYGIDYRRTDGDDVEAVWAAVRAARADIRDRGGPVFLEASTYRWAGHYEGDPQHYRDPAEVERAQAESDPLRIAAARLTTADPALDLAAVDGEIAGSIAAAARTAAEDDVPAPATVLDFVYQPVQTGAAPVVRDTSTLGRDGRWRTMDAVRTAVEDEMTADPRVFMAGIDIGQPGNVFGLFRGLAERFPGRLRDTPICETGILGTGVGAAMAGLRPVVEIMYMDFLGVCFDQILNQAAKMRFMTGGGAAVPLVVRTQFGAGRSSGSQHSQSLEAMLAHIPGLVVVMPSDPASTYGLLRSAIRDPNPVVFVENRLLYGRKEPVPDTLELVPLGRAAVVREGSDLTIVSYSRMVFEALDAATQLGEAGMSCEVIDLRTVAPWDRETVGRSLAKTGRLLIAHEGVREHGLGAELAAWAVDEGFWKLDGPVGRVGAAFSPAPYSPGLERAWLPGAADIVAEAHRIYLD